MIEIGEKLRDIFRWSFRGMIVFVIGGFKGFGLV